MKRTQLYLDEDLWLALHVRAKQSGSTVSELVRQAVRKTYAPSSANRKEAMSAIVGLWADRTDIGDSTEYIRKLRRGTRLDRLK